MAADPGPALPPPQVLCCGEALLDRLLPEPSVAAGAAADDYLGGAPANVACALARLGTPSAFLGRLGQDATGEALVRLLRQRGVHTAALQWDPLRPTRIVLVERTAAGDRCFGGFAGDRGAGFADQWLDPQALLAAAVPWLAGARWLLVGTLALASARSAQAVEALVMAASAAGVALAVDVNWRPTFWGLDPASAPPPAVRHRIRQLLERAQLIRCAREEAEALFDDPAPVAIQRTLPLRPAVVVSDGSGPIRWCFGPQAGDCPSFAVPVVDTTGAGDAFTAALLHQLCRQSLLLQGQLPEGQVLEALQFAAACGALVCAAPGAIDPQPDPAAVAAFLQRQQAALTGPVEERAG